jgi:hypothetical protein
MRMGVCGVVYRRFNVQDPVRFALESIIGHVQEQSRAIAKLEQSTAGLADKTNQRWASSQALETLRSQVFDSQVPLPNET